MEIETENMSFDKISYIYWLEDYTNKGSSIFSDSILLFSSDLTDKDRKNVDNIGLLFDEVDKYASKNYISIKESVYEKHYSIKYNDIGYNIGISKEFGQVYFCSRTNKEKNYIDYNNVINNNKEPYAEFFDSELECFGDVLNTVISDGVPAEVIKDYFDSIIKSHEKIKIKRL